mgnify:CR=1 FL=1
MPLPVLTQKIVNASLRPETGWSLLELKDIRSQKAKEKESINYFFDFECLSGPDGSQKNQGRSITLMINGGGLASGIPEVCNIYNQALCALLNTTYDNVVGKEVKDDHLIGKTMWCKFDYRTVEGNLYPDFKAIQPSNEIPF